MTAGARGISSEAHSGGALADRRAASHMKRMGLRSDAVCRACGHTFFNFSLLHCDTCGLERSVDQGAVPEVPVYRCGVGWADGDV